MARNLFAAILMALFTSTADAQDDRGAERGAMVEAVRRMAQALAETTARPTISERVLAALAKVPRHAFVPIEEARNAYRNRPAPIGLGQTISQPYIVALMTDLLALEPAHRVLEVGTGSGYQAAILSLLAREVYSVEIHAPLAERAAQTLAQLGYANVTVRAGDGYEGWPEHAPYDAIIVTAAPDHVPQALVEQLKAGGRLVIPVGVQEQDLMVVTKAPDGGTTSTRVVPVRFVPLTREGGDKVK